MDALVNTGLGLAAKIAREFRDIPGLPHAEIFESKQAAHKLAGAAIASLRDALADMGYSGLDTLGLLLSGCVSGCVSGCGVSPQAVTEASRLRPSPPQVDDFPPRP